MYFSNTLSGSLINIILVLENHFGVCLLFPCVLEWFITSKNSLFLKGVKELACGTVCTWEGLGKQDWVTLEIIFLLQQLFCVVFFFFFFLRFFWNKLLSHFWQAQTGHLEGKTLRYLAPDSSTQLQSGAPCQLWATHRPPGGFSWTQGAHCTSCSFGCWISTLWWDSKGFGSICSFDNLRALTWKTNEMVFQFFMSLCWWGQSRTHNSGPQVEQGRLLKWDNILPF